MKILHAPTNVGGHPTSLAHAERALGLDSDTLAYSSVPFADSTTFSLNLGRSKVLDELKRQRFFWANFLRYDVFHFNFGGSFFSYGRRLWPLDFWDLPVLKLARRKVVVTYQGCDARQKDYCLTHFEISPCAEADCYGGTCNAASDERKRRHIGIVQRYADQVWALNPDLLHVLPRAEFMPYASADPAEWRPVPPSNDAKLRVLHAPTDKGAKGSRYIAEAVRKLAAENSCVEYIEVTNVPHSQVRAIYEKADLVIDQILAGWYGGLAVECMALSKPVVCYIRDEDLKFIPPAMAAELPVIRATPQNLYEVLRGVIESKQRLSEVGAQSRAYVERWHDPMKIAARTKQRYEELAGSRERDP
jgi:hypothetical protein